MVSLKEGSRPPWIGLGAAVWLQIASGNAYNFPLYSHSLKSVLGFSQHQLTMLGVANDIGENLGLLPGLACNKLPPWLILLIGAFACFSGYGLLWLALARTLQLPHWLLWIALCVATNSSAWLSTAVLVTNMRNFPLNRGTVAGILKGYGGISAAVFTAIYSMVLDSSSSKLLLFLALGIPLLCFLLMYFVKACTPALAEDSTQHTHFLFIQMMLIILGIYILITTILDHLFRLSNPILFSILALMILLVMSPLVVPIKMTFNRFRTKNLAEPNGPNGHFEDIAEKTEPLLESFEENEEMCEVAMLLAEGEGAIKKKRKPKRGEDFKFSEAIVKADFWLLFFVYFFGVGSGVTVLNNLAQIGIAQGVHDTTILLTVFSFCNFVGRLGGGAVSEHFVRTKTLPRTIWMACTQVVMIITYLLFASAIKGSLYTATALLGICYGVQFSIMIPTVSELFGLKHFGIFYNFIGIGNPLGAFLFSGLLAGYVYDTEAAKQHGLNVLFGSSMSCVGPNCFRLTFLVLAGVCFVGSILGVVLTMRLRPVYMMLYSGGSFRIPNTSSH